MMDKIICGDCLKLMPEIPDHSIDMILCDLPYGTTQCSWDTIIPFAPLWEQYKRVLKPNGAIVLTASQPFTSMLVMSNIEWFRYEWIWEKTNAGDFMLAKYRPRKKHENVLVFSDGKTLYNAQMEKGMPYRDKPRKRTNRIVDSTIPKLGIVNEGTRYPSSVQKFSNGNNDIDHPTQKPIPLFTYLINTYTNEGEVVLDNCIGSGTTAIAAIRTGRHYIGIEQEQKYVDIANERIRIERSQLKLDLGI